MEPTAFMKSYEETLLKLLKTSYINKYEDLDSLKKKYPYIYDRQSPIITEEKPHQFSYTELEKISEKENIKNV